MCSCLLHSRCVHLLACLIKVRFVNEPALDWGGVRKVSCPFYLVNLWDNLSNCCLWSKMIVESFPSWNVMTIAILNISIRGSHSCQRNVRNSEHLGGAHNNLYLSPAFTLLLLDIFLLFLALASRLHWQACIYWANLVNAEKPWVCSNQKRMTNSAIFLERLKGELWLCHNAIDKFTKSRLHSKYRLILTSKCVGWRCD